MNKHNPAAGPTIDSDGSAPASSVRLAPLTHADSDTFFSWINQRRLVLSSGYYSPISDVAHAAWFERIRSDPNVKIFGIREDPGDRLIGSCQLHSLDPVARCAELQIRIGAEDGRGKGFGKQSVALLLEHAFADLNLNRVFLHVLEDNPRAIRAYLANGFQHEGVLRQSAFVDGEYKNMIVMGILSKEYSALRHHV